LLRQRSERPCDTRAQECDKLAPPHRFPRPKRYCALQGSIFSPCAGNRWRGPNSLAYDARRIAANIAKLPEQLTNRH
jgi:hypothetical protein